MEIEELVKRGFTLLDLVQAPGANITVEVLEGAGIPPDEIAVLKTALVDQEAGGNNAGTIVAVMVVMLLVFVVLFLLYRRRNSSTLLPEDLDANITGNKAFENPQYSASHAGANTGGIDFPAGIANRTSATKGTGNGAVRGNGGGGAAAGGQNINLTQVYGDTAYGNGTSAPDENKSANAQVYAVVTEDDTAFPAGSAGTYEDGTPVPGVGGGGTTSSQLYAIPMEDSEVAGGVAGTSNTIVVGNSGGVDGGNNAYDAWGNGASGMSGNAAVVAHSSNIVGSSVGNVVDSNNTYDAWGNGAAGTSGNAAILAHMAHNSSGSNAIYVSTGNGAGDDDGESDIYRTLHGDARGDQSSTTNTQLYAIPMAEEEGGAPGGGSQGVGTFKLAGGQAGTIVAAAASGAYEVMVATDGIYAPVGGGRPRLQSVCTGFGQDAEA